jgi:Alkylmercury lyase
MPNDLDRRPGLPASDLHKRIREAAFALLLTKRRPIAADEIAVASGVQEAVLPTLLNELARAGWLDRDEEDRVTGSAGLSLTTGAHRIQIDGAEFRTWCAYDSIGIAAALGSDARITTACAVCGVALSLDTRAGSPPAGRPERLWLAAGGTNLRGDFCDPTVLLCSSEHATIWAEQQRGRGRAVDLTEAAELGAEAWASCAAVVSAVSDWSKA